MATVEDGSQVFSDFQELTIEPTAGGSCERNLPIYNWNLITEDFLSACKRQ